MPSPKDGKNYKTDVAKEDGEVAGNAQKDIEERTEKPIITSKNAVDFSNFISYVIEKDFDKNE